VKILLIGNYLPDRQHSMLRFAALLEAELTKAGHAVRLIRPEVRLGRLGKVGRGLAKWMGYVDKFVLFPARLRRSSEAADVVHICDHANSPYIRHLDRVACIVTCHDLIAARGALGEYPEVRTKWSGKIYQRMIRDGLQHARHIACDSGATRADVLRLCNITPSRTSVIYIALNFAYQPVNPDERTLYLGRLGIAASERFILHVGSSSWYKNQPGVIKMFGRLAASPKGRDLGLVMVSASLSPASRRFIAESGLQPRVRVLSNVEPVELRALYGAATALIFPSLYEGFGWPIIEAQACGCPVFTSNRAPMTEVGGDAAVYLDPENPEEAATTILENLSRAARMREAGFANVRRFKRENMVADYVSSYAQAVMSFSSPSASDATASTRPANAEADSTESYPWQRRL
jgi:glycosyltransferase involved in cell wall biosynthesis